MALKETASGFLCCFIYVLMAALAGVVVVHCL